MANPPFPGGGSAQFSEISDDRRPSGSSPFRRLPEPTQLRYLASLLLGNFLLGLGFCRFLVSWRSERLSRTFEEIDQRW